MRVRREAPGVVFRKGARCPVKEGSMAKIQDTQTMNYEVAETLAPTWAKRAPQIEQVTAPVREWLVQELAPSAGDVVLELAAGVGDTGFDAAELIGEAGKLISSDFSPKMLEEARRRGAERGIVNVEYQVIDAERIELEDDSVDGVICRYGYMLMADTAAALAQTRRVLRPTGRLTLAVWGPPERNPFFSILGAKLVEAGHVPPPEPPPAPGIFAMGSSERTKVLLKEAGFGEVRVAEVGVLFRVPSVREYLEFTADTAGPIAIALRSMSGEDREALEPSLEEAFAGFATGEGYELPGVTLCAVGS
jgi:ubiquinone/menaquinone biosynthesis C-methylase UbiE